MKIVGPDGEYGRIQLKLEWLVATPGKICPGGCIIMISIGELRQPGVEMKGKKLAVRAKLKEEVLTTFSGKPIKGAHELPSVVKALEEVKENLERAKVPQQTISKALA